MEKRIIESPTTSVNEIIRAAREYFGQNGYTVHNETTENDVQIIRGEKPGNIFGYNLYVKVEKSKENRYTVEVYWQPVFSNVLCIVAPMPYGPLGMAYVACKEAKLKKAAKECMEYIINRIKMETRSILREKTIN